MGKGWGLPLQVLDFLGFPRALAATVRETRAKVSRGPSSSLGGRSWPGTGDGGWGMGQGRVALARLTLAWGTEMVSRSRAGL